MEMVLIGTINTQKYCKEKLDSCKNIEFIVDQFHHWKLSNNTDDQYIWKIERYVIWLISSDFVLRSFYNIELPFIEEY